MRSPLSRLLLLCLLLGTAYGAVAVAAAPPRNPFAGGFDPRPVSDPKVRIPRAVHGEEAVRLLGGGLNSIAARYGGTGAGLAGALRQNADLWIDRQTRLNYRCSFGLKPNGKGELIPPRSSARLASGPANAPFPLEQTFLLHSLPASKKKIYLDFDGHLSTGTAWNGNGDINAIPYSIDGDRTTFNDTEKEEIQKVWQRVAEDFSPWDVDVTTEEPDIENLKKTSSADDAYGIRVICTPTTDAAPGAGGVAFFGSFQWDVDTGCWAFTESVGNTAENIAEVCSHEVGHTVGLNHDGKTDGTEYYGGHNGWAPIMGVAYGAQVGQFSKGEYANANNLEDDFVVIPQNGMFPRADDHGNGPSSATPIQGTNPVRAGIIGNQTDVDYFSFLTGNGSVTFTVDPAPNSPNLNVQLAILNSSNQVIASTSGTGMGATLTQSLTAGSYYVRVDGEGEGTPSTGYSDYGSIGQYTLNGFLPPTLFKVSGRVTLAGNGLGGVTVTGGNQSAVTNSQGFYTINNLFDGTNIIKPRKPGFAFTPTSRTVVLGPDQTGVDFTAEVATYTISGKVMNGATGVPDVLVNASGEIASEVTGNAQPNQNIPDNKTTGLTRSLSITGNGVIAGVSLEVDIAHSNVSDLEISLSHPDGTTCLVYNRSQDGANLNTSFPSPTPSVDGFGIFNGKPVQGSWSIKVRDLAPFDNGKLKSWTLRLQYIQNFSNSVRTDANGAYRLTNLQTGIYRVRAISSSYGFNPTRIDVNVGPTEAHANFDAYQFPAAPTGMTAVATSTTAVDLAWTDNASNETGFEIERKDGSAAYKVLAKVGANIRNFRDTTMPPNQTYAYRVRALNGAAASSFSSPASVRVLDQPTNLVLTPLAGQRMSLTWVDNAAGELNYVVYRRVGAGALAPYVTLGANVTAYTDTAVTAGVSYTYNVRATATNSTSTPSNGEKKVAKP